MDLGGSWVLELGTFKPVSPGGWGWIQWGWRWMWWWPVLCPRVQQLLWWGSSALTGCLCLPRGPYIRHKLSPGLMFDFVWRINIRQLECCAPTKPSSPEKGLPQPRLVGVETGLGNRLWLSLEDCWLDKGLSSSGLLS